MIRLPLAARCAPERRATLVWPGNGHWPSLEGSTLREAEAAAVIDHLTRPKPLPYSRGPGLDNDEWILTLPYRERGTLMYFVCSLGAETDVFPDLDAMNESESEPKPEPGRVRVRDGVVEPHAWRAAPMRVLWLLREVNDVAGTWRGVADGGMPTTLFEWSLARTRHKEGVRTWGPIAKVSYGLLHPDEPWSTWSTRPARYYASLRSIATANVKKVAGGSVSKWGELVDAYEENEDELWSQIEEADPHVVIGGNVLWLFRERLGWDPPRLPKVRDREVPSYAAVRHNGQVWVHAHHPAHRGQHERYYQRIRAAVEAHLPFDP